LGKSFFNELSPINVLLPKGNYASRITNIEGKYLVWNFFTSERDPSRIIPPPTELIVEDDGQLHLKSYENFDQKVKITKKASQLLPLLRLLKNPSAKTKIMNRETTMETKSGYEIFLVKPSATDFRLNYSICLNGFGKTGIIFRADSEANGHYISLDLMQGTAQGRVWGERTDGGIEKSFSYINIQTNHFRTTDTLKYDVEVIGFGGYIELSINQRIVLRYVDTKYMIQGSLGFYVESARISITNLVLDIL
jgi:beta-fructofuranosidase